MREGWRLLAIRDLVEQTDERLGLRPEPTILSLTEGDGFVRQTDKYKKRIASADTTSYKTIQEDDIAYNPYLLWKGAIAQSRFPEICITSPIYEVFRPRPDHDPRFVGSLLSWAPMVNLYDAISVGTVERRRRAVPARFLDLPVAVPPLAEQRRIVDLIQAVDVAIEYASAVKRQASVLWHSWAEDVWTTTDQEVQLGAIGRAITGSTPSTARPEYWHPEEVPFFGPGDLGDEPVLTESRRSVSRAGADAVRPIPAPSVAQVCVGFGTGKVAVLGVPGCTNQQMNALTGLDEVDAITVMAMLRSAAGQDRLRSIRGLTVTPVVKKSAWAAMRVRWPSREARTLLCGVVTDAACVADNARRTAEALGVLRATLLGELFEGRHEIPASYDRLIEGAA